MPKKNTFTLYKDFIFECPCGKKMNFGTMKDMDKYEKLHGKYCKFSITQTGEVNEIHRVIANRPTEQIQPARTP